MRYKGKNGVKMDEKFCIFYKTLLVSDVCPNCQKNQPSSVEEKIITIYFLQGYQCKTILKFLAEHHKIKMSLCTLKTRLKQLKLGRRNLMNETTVQKLDTAILLEYHWVFVPRDAVMLALKQLDPDCSFNRSK